VTNQHIARADAPGGVGCCPSPHWVEHESYSSQVPDAQNACVADGVARLLQDLQVNLGASEIAWHTRTAQRVLTRAGAERVAHFLAEFDPGFQRIDVHFIRTLRGGEFIEHARPNAFQMLRRESNLERLVLNGRLTASLLIPDVRVDDIIEVSLTVYGSDPALAGKYASGFVFDAFNPWLEVRHRLLRPLARQILISPLNDPPGRVATEKDGVEESKWRLVGQPRRDAEKFTPPWLILSPVIQVTEFDAWNDVARLFSPFFENVEIPKDLTGEIDRLAAANTDETQRASEWLFFVQRTLRYFALSLGEGGFVPRGLEAIWDSRFGDCKDATRLYIAGARRMGLDACAALVSTTHGPALDAFMPTPNAFDHCIVRLRLNGVSYWLDPTLPTQSGALDNIDMPYVGWALPLTPDATELEKLGSEAPVHCLDCDDELHFGPKRESPVKLRRRIKHFSWVADMARNRTADQGTAEYSRAMLRELQSIWPGVSETVPVEISDDPAGNCLTTTFTFEIRDGWKRDPNGRLSFTIADQILPRELVPIPGAPRLTDIFAGRPRKLTRRVRMEMPSKWIGNGWYQVEETSSLSFVDRLATSGKVIESSRELIIKAWSVPAAETARYGELVGKIHQNLLNIWARERFGRIRPPGPNWLAAVLALVFLFVLFGFLGSLTSNVPERGKAGLRPADSLDRTRSFPFPPLPFPGEGKPSSPFPTPLPPR
jgi:transglutaminase-like putative cysteine protease